TTNSSCPVTFPPVAACTCQDRGAGAPAIANQVEPKPRTRACKPAQPAHGGTTHEIRRGRYRTGELARPAGSRVGPGRPRPGSPQVTVRVDTCERLTPYELMRGTCVAFGQGATRQTPRVSTNKRGNAAQRTALRAVHTP